MILLLDTHAVLWMTENRPALGSATRRLIDGAAARDELAVAAFSFWEIAMLVAKKRLSLAFPPDVYRRRALETGLREIAVSGDIGIAAVSLPGLPGDPADRIIVATARARGAVLVTADERLLAWTGPLRTHDARL